MRTARLLTVSQHALPGGGVSPEGVSAQGGACPGVVCPGGCIPACNGPDPQCGQTDTCENITFANFVYRR